jgi:small ligand-binding sensory domain FIST
VAVAADVHPGQVVRLHARDAASADRDLRDALGVRMRALGGRTPAGALLFSCNSRGRGMFGTADHDAEVVDDGLGGSPAAGFFAAGEIGPVSGQAFLHSFTATVAVFA